MTIQFDKKYWPECGSRIGIRPADGYDLNDLWDTHRDQSSVFVAEALIADPPDIYLALESHADVTVSLWEVGGDTVMVSEPLVDLIDRSYRDYDQIRGPEQEQDVKDTLAQLERISDAISRARDELKKQLDEYASTA